MITVAGGATYREASELDLQHYIDLAKAEVGKTHDLQFQSNANWGQKAGEFTILSFEEKDAGWKLNDCYERQGLEVINGAKLGIFTIQLHGTKIYKEKIMRFPVQAYVQDKEGTNDHLFISNCPEGKNSKIRAYSFPILNWD